MGKRIRSNRMGDLHVDKVLTHGTRYVINKIVNERMRRRIEKEIDGMGKRINKNREPEERKEVKKLKDKLERVKKSKEIEGKRKGGKGRGVPNLENP